MSSYHLQLLTPRQIKILCLIARWASIYVSTGRRSWNGLIGRKERESETTKGLHLV
jgi:hypothetical protein